MKNRVKVVEEEETEKLTAEDVIPVEADQRQEGSKRESLETSLLNEVEESMKNADEQDSLEEKEPEVESEESAREDGEREEENREEEEEQEDREEEEEQEDREEEAEDEWLMMAEALETGNVHPNRVKELLNDAAFLERFLVAFADAGNRTLRGDLEGAATLRSLISVFTSFLGFLSGAEDHRGSDDNAGGDAKSELLSFLTTNDSLTFASSRLLERLFPEEEGWNLVKEVASEPWANQILLDLISLSMDIILAVAASISSSSSSRDFLAALLRSTCPVLPRFSRCSTDGDLRVRDKAQYCFVLVCEVLTGSEAGNVGGGPTMFETVLLTADFADELIAWLLRDLTFVDRDWVASALASIGVEDSETAAEERCAESVFNAVSALAAFLDAPPAISLPLKRIKRKCCRRVAEIFIADHENELMNLLSSCGNAFSCVNALKIVYGLLQTSPSLTEMLMGNPAFVELMFNVVADVVDGDADRSDELIQLVLYILTIFLLHAESRALPLFTPSRKNLLTALLNDPEVSAESRAATALLVSQWLDRQSGEPDGKDFDEDVPSGLDDESQLVKGFVDLFDQISSSETTASPTVSPPFEFGRDDGLLSALRRLIPTVGASEADDEFARALMGHVTRCVERVKADAEGGKPGVAVVLAEWKEVSPAGLLVALQLVVEVFGSDPGWMIDALLTNMDDDRRGLDLVLVLLSPKLLFQLRHRDPVVAASIVCLLSEILRIPLSGDDTPQTHVTALTAAYHDAKVLPYLILASAGFNAIKEGVNDTEQNVVMVLLSSVYSLTLRLTLLEPKFAGQFLWSLDNVSKVKDRLKSTLTASSPLVPVFQEDALLLMMTVLKTKPDRVRFVVEELFDDGMESLLEFVVEAESPKVQVAAISLVSTILECSTTELGWTKSPSEGRSVSSVLASSLSSPSLEVRSATASAVGRLTVGLGRGFEDRWRFFDDLPTLIPRLVARLEDAEEDDVVKRKVVVALGRLASLVEAPIESLADSKAPESLLAALSEFPPFTLDAVVALRLMANHARLFKVIKKRWSSKGIGSVGDETGLLKSHVDRLSRTLEVGF